MTTTELARRPVEAYGLPLERSSRGQDASGSPVGNVPVSEVVEPQSGPRKRLLAAVDTAWPATLLVAAIVLAWELYARYSGIKATTLPAPSRVVEQIVVNRQALVDNALPTIGATLSGFALSVTAAFLSSVLVDFVRPLRRALFPVFIISQTLPLVAIAPLVVLWFGFGLLPKILLVALVTFFPMMVALVQGYDSTEKDMEWLLRSMGASRAQVFLKARLPSAIPFFFTGLRISITYAVVGAIFAEYAGAAKGLGIYMLAAKNNFRPDLVLAAVFCSALLTLVLFGCTVVIQRLATPWEQARKGDGK
ncbi:Binding-protein-dependent transport systems inner membrane component [Mesorhizobium plurifarium]|uniref:Binding-protein-dependent transport systems inner membrane component n=1 Tax=Mesorhizobium plurifarium TaxID=69974 RepID=A0A0K2VQA8_MESPL|nr:Binding-protein-dependent transport systems inner membrane component [Mesorhizobium plurifarium]